VRTGVGCFHRSRQSARDQPVHDAADKTRGWKQDVGAVEQRGGSVEIQQLIEDKAERATNGEEVEDGPQSEDSGQQDRHGGECEGSGTDGAGRENERDGEIVGVGANGTEGADDYQRGGGDHGQDVASRNKDQKAEHDGQGVASRQPAIMASRAMRSRIFMRSDSLLSWPQAARMSRPRGVRIGEA
jgi:hypothetical protein